jgi:hypothetical protein
VFVSASILLCCLGLIVYWLHSSVLTLLDGKRAVADAVRIAEMNHLEFLMVRQFLAASPAPSRCSAPPDSPTPSRRSTPPDSPAPGDYGRLMAALRHDFLALTYLLRFAATIDVGRYSSQERLLVMDFHLMRVLCVLGRWVSPELARYALREMTDVLEHFAIVIGRRISSFELDTVRP